MTDHWLQLEITVQGEFAEQVADLLTSHAAVAVSMQDAKNQALFQLQPQDQPLWQQTMVTALFPADSDLKLIQAAIEAELGANTILSFTINSIAEQDWVRQTQQNFPARCYANTLWVIPSWESTEHYQGLKVKLDPGLAFGTGTHPTTALCLEWLAHHPPRNLNVIDYGCGSGILAIAALALGAKRVYAIDHDAQALEATANNAKLNHFANDRNLILALPEQLTAVTSPFIIANILSGPLLDLLPTFNQLSTKNATLVLSGLLVEETDKIINAYADFFSLSSCKTRDEWVRLVLQKH